MSRIKKLLNEQYALDSLYSLIDAYEEIAALRMRKVKVSVLRSRTFLQGLNDIYGRVLTTFQEEGGSLKDLLKTITPNGTVSVLLSANTGLYGDIIERTFELFAKDIANASTDVIVVGQVGQRLFKERFPSRTARFVHVSDAFHGALPQELLSTILSYRNVIVYHGLFVSILQQDSVSTYVTGNALSNAEGRVLKCIIEPSPAEVLAFFRKQIVITLFEQTFFESTLSKYASRMVSLDSARDTIDVKRAEVHMQRIRLKHAIQDRRQQELLSGLFVQNL